MSYAGLTPSAGIAIARDAAGLGAFLAPDCAAAIWPRQTPEAMQSWLDRLDPGRLPCTRFVVAPGAVAQSLAACFDASRLPKGPGRDWLEADIAELTQTFAGLLAAPMVRVRLSVVENNACRKFHRDALTARLVCTYRGTGTQYGHGAPDRDPTQVFTVPTGSPVLLRGSLWAPEPDQGVLHRSPPIEGSGESRFVVVLDPVTSIEDDI